MGFLIGLFARWGVPEPLRRLAAIVTLVLGALALCGLAAGAWALFVHRHDKQVIVNHDAVQAAQVTKTELNAEHAADAKQEARTAERQSQTEALNTARAEAQRSNPDEAAKPSGPAVSAVLQRLREQQSASGVRPAGK